MSDDDKNGAWDANSGLTMPSGPGATHNISLSPLFIAKVGRTMTWDNEVVRAVSERGMYGHVWASNIYPAGASSWAYFMTIHSYDIQPSDKNNAVYGQTLRCLVSTTNS